MRREHVVVGGGTSGLMLVHRLLDRDDVILIDIENDDDAATDQPNNTFTNTTLNLYSALELWTHNTFMDTTPVERYLTNAQHALCNRQIEYVQGTGYGGSSNINAMIWTTGCASVFDRFWPAEWNSARIDESISRVKKFVQPTLVSSSGAMRRLIEGSKQNGIRRNDTAHTEHRTPLWDDAVSCRCQYYTTISESKLSRNRLFHKVLAPSALAAKAGRLTFVRGRVGRVVFNEDVATAVELLPSPTVMRRCVTPSNGGEIVLCAGALETPRILFQSGLRADVHAAVSSCIGEGCSDLPNLPDIGENLQDHPLVPLLCVGDWHREWGLFHSALRDEDGRPRHPSGYEGQPLYPLNGVHGWVNLDAQGRVHSGGDGGDAEPPSAQLLFVDGRIASGLTDLLLPRFPRPSLYMDHLRPLLSAVLKWVARRSVVQWLLGYVFGVLVCVTRPRSRGRLSVDPQRPRGPLAVDPAYLSDARDRQVLKSALATAQRLVAAANARGDLRSAELLPGPLFGYGRSARALDLFVSLFANPYFHACGTCAMATTGGEGADPGTDVQHRGVVGPDLRVKGVKGLRVADASVIPSIPSGPTAALCMVIGDVAAELIMDETSRDCCPKM